MNNSIKSTRSSTAAAAVTPPQYFPCKVKVETADKLKSPHESSPSKDFFINLNDMSMEKLVLMMRTEAITMKDYLETMPPSQTSQLSESQQAQLMSEYAGLSPSEIMQKTEHQLLLAISKQLETIDEFDAHLGSKISGNTVNALQDLCSILTKQHGCMRSQQHKLPESSCFELGHLITHLEKISAHIYLNIPKLGTTPNKRFGNHHQPCPRNPVSPTKLVIKKTKVMTQAAKRLQDVTKSKDTATNDGNDAPLMIVENEIVVEDKNNGLTEEGHENNDDPLLVSPAEADAEDVQFVHEKHLCSYPSCNESIPLDDLHSTCIAHSPCMSSVSFNPASCRVCLDVFQKANSGDRTSRRVWTYRLRRFQRYRSKNNVASKTPLYVSPDLALRFKLKRRTQGLIGNLTRTPTTATVLAPVPPLIRIEEQKPEEEHANSEKIPSQQSADSDLLNWKVVMHLIDDFFGRPASLAIPYMSMVVSMINIDEFAFVREILHLLISELQEQLPTVEGNCVEQKTSDHKMPRFDHLRADDNIKDKQKAFQWKLLAILVNHDIPMSHIESYVSPQVEVINKAITSLAVQEQLSPEQVKVLVPSGDNWDTQFKEGDVKTCLLAVKLSQQAMRALQQELLLQLQSPSTVAAKRLRSPGGVLNGDGDGQQKTSLGSSSSSQLQEEGGVARATPTFPSTQQSTPNSSHKSTAEQVQDAPLKRPGDKNYGLPSKKIKTGPTTAAVTSLGVADRQSVRLKSGDNTSTGNSKSANEHCEDRTMMSQQKELQMEMPVATAASANQSAPGKSPAKQPLNASSLRGRPNQTSTNGCLDQTSVQKAPPDLHQLPSCSNGSLNKNGIRRDSASAAAPEGHVAPANITSANSTSHTRKQLAPRRTVRPNSNTAPEDCITSSSVVDAIIPPSNGPSITSSSSSSSGGSSNSGSRRNSQECDEVMDVCEVIQGSQQTEASIRTTSDSEGSTHNTRVKSNGTTVNGASNPSSNGVRTLARKSDSLGPKVPRPIAPKVVAPQAVTPQAVTPQAVAPTAVAPKAVAPRTYPAASKPALVNGTGGGDPKENPEENEPHPGEDWFPAPASGLFKMIDNVFVMRFHGNMYKSPEVELQYFDKKMWFKVLLNCVKTAHLLKYVKRDNALNCRQDKAKALRSDVFKRITHIFSKSFTPTASISKDQFCSLQIDHFPSQIQHLLYKEKERAAKQAVGSSNLKHDHKFNLEHFLETHWIYDLCSKNNESRNFIKYLEQKDPTINSYSGFMNNTEELVRLKEEESLARSRLHQMSTILCGQELITDILSKFNAQIDNTYPQQLNISNGYTVDEAAAAATCSSTKPSLETGQGTVGGQGLRATPVERTFKETLIQIEQFHRGVETQANSLMAVLMEEAAQCKLKWRRFLLAGDETTPVAQRLLRSNIYTENVFDETVVEEVRRELKIRTKKIQKKKDDLQSFSDQFSGSS